MLNITIGRHIQGGQLFDYWRGPDGFLVEHFAGGEISPLPGGGTRQLSHNVLSAMTSTNNLIGQRFQHIPSVFKDSVKRWCGEDVASGIMECETPIWCH
jgi:hypothetical protein